MATSYRTLSESELVWEANRVRADTELRIVLRRIRNEVMAKLSSEFNAGLDAGVVLTLKHSRQEIEALAAKAAAGLQPARIESGSKRR